jgi:hypothetical protein
VHPPFKVNSNDFSNKVFKKSKLSLLNKNSIMRRLIVWRWPISRWNMERPLNSFEWNCGEQMRDIFCKVIYLHHGKHINILTHSKIHLYPKIIHAAWEVWHIEKHWVPLKYNDIIKMHGNTIEMHGNIPKIQWNISKYIAIPLKCHWNFLKYNWCTLK